jgi:hypothetical protein
MLNERSPQPTGSGSPTWKLDVELPKPPYKTLVFLTVLEQPWRASCYEPVDKPSVP